MSDTMKCQMEVGGNLRTGTVIECGMDTDLIHPEYHIPVCWDHHPDPTYVDEE